MESRYTSTEAIDALVRAFESGTVARDEWGHAEHLVVAFRYASEGDYESAFGRMKAGIHDLLDAFGIDRSKEMPYHETLTVFWMRTVFEFTRKNKAMTDAEICAGLIGNFDKDYPLRFYSRERLFSDEARGRFVPPDLGEFEEAR